MTATTLAHPQMDYSHEKSVAIEAVSQAVRLCTAIQSDLIQATVLEKQDTSPVTIADFGAQALICRHLAERFPNDVIVGEEDSRDLRGPGSGVALRLVTQYVREFYAEATSGEVCRWIDKGNGDVTDRFWTVDPIDGTKGFLRHDQYAIALALVEGGQVRVGVLGCPVLRKSLVGPGRDAGVMFVAVHGEGASMADLNQSAWMPIHVASGENEVQQRFVQSVESAHGDSDLQQAVARAVGITRPALRLDSQAKYGAVARGDAVLYLRFPSTRDTSYREKIWDHVAGALIVEEAGGQVTDMLGQALDFASNRRMLISRGLVASNGLLHHAVFGYK